MVKQKLSERYTDKQALQKLLVRLFGTGTFEIEVCHSFILDRYDVRWEMG